MAAALPHVDRFLPVSRLADLETLGALLAAPAIDRSHRFAA
jgi:uncharacterized protein with von Willebrand factor type A (vWA) domain